MYIAKKEGYAGSWDYFQDNIDDSPKWTKEKNRAGKFSTKEEAESHANPTGLYEIIFEEV